MNPVAKKLLKATPGACPVGDSLVSIPARFRYLQDDRKFTSLCAGMPSRCARRWADRLASLGDRTAGTEFDRHYVHHPAWATRVLMATRPKKHVAVSSALGFCSNVSAFLPAKYYD